MKGRREPTDWMGDLDKQKYLYCHKKRISITLSKLKEHKNNSNILRDKYDFF